jgi:hypothetical protein
MNNFTTSLYKAKNTNMKFQNTVWHNCHDMHKCIGTVQIFVFTNGDSVRTFCSIAFFKVAHIFIICLPVGKEFMVQVHVILAYRMIHVKSD